MKQIAILGRQDKLGLAELVARMPGKVKPLGRGFAALSEPIKNPEQFGGIVRLTQPIGEIDDPSWQGLLRHVEEFVEDNDEFDGKINIAIHSSEWKMPYKKQQADLLSLKKRLRGNGYSIRMVMPKNNTINAAQVKSSKLASPGNIEVTTLKTKSGILAIRTTWSQDIDAYADRDYKRPMRDGFVGMLPPKLAQIMLNISGIHNINNEARILDPFCGTGVVLQESLLMGFKAYGTDLADKMVEYTDKNIDWLKETHVDLPSHNVEQGDAKSFKWTGEIDAVVCETYLGEPQTKVPNTKKISQLSQESANLIGAFLKNIHPQLKEGTPLVVAIPAWRNSKNKWIDSPVIDSINRLGYTRTSLEHVSHRDLIYFRPDQFVARRLLVLRRK